MNISIGNGLDFFTPFSVGSMRELAEVICQTPWSPATFKDNHRLKSNFISTELIALDVDDGMSLDQALEIFKGMKHVIATTRSHQKDKNGTVCDRFRVVLCLSELVSDSKRFEATARSLIDMYGSDPQCKDASRMFYECVDVVSVNEDGQKVQVLDAPIVETPPTRSNLSSEQKGRLSKSTLEFLVMGAEPGQWNISLFKAAKDWQEQGYDEAEFIDRASLIEAPLDDKDLSTVRSAFNSPPKYEPRLVAPGVVDEPLIVTSRDLVGSLTDYLSDKDLVKGQLTGLDGFDKLLAGKRLGEVTALCAEGKTGKNALWHFMQHIWLQKGIKFAYASRELDPDTEVLPDYLSMEFEKNIRLTEMNPATSRSISEQLIAWDIPFAGGRGYFPLDKMEEWIKVLKNRGVDYFFFDHLHWMCNDPEDYKEASQLSRQLKLLARRYQVHIDVIIQPKVLMDGQKPTLNSMKGGSAIGQNVDNFFTLERVPGHKFISKLSLKAKRSRLAETGEIYLKYNPDTLKFHEMEMQEEELNAPIGLHKQLF